MSAGDGRVLLLICTGKGAFILESDADRRSWTQRGPFCDVQPVHHVIGDRRTGRIYAGGGNPWFGVGVWQSDDRGATWTKNGDGLTYGEEAPTLKTVWSLAAAPDRLLAGVEPAGLFESFDDGRSWHHVRGLRDHPSRPQWQAGGGGLILHSILPHPDDPDRCWVGISAAGVFHTSDGGRNWEPRNRGTRADFLPEDQRYPEIGRAHV